jgi:hypothetical protein
MIKYYKSEKRDPFVTGILIHAYKQTPNGTVHILVSKDPIVNLLSYDWQPDIECKPITANEFNKAFLDAFNILNSI